MTMTNVNTTSALGAANVSIEMARGAGGVPIEQIRQHNRRDTDAGMKSILIADDDELLVRFMVHKLRGRGFEVVSAADGAQALRLANERKPNLIVLDAMMPELDGFEVLRRLKEAPETSEIPVLMLTARKQARDVVTGLSLGASDYLVKPFMPEELLMRIQKLLGT